MPVSVVTTSVLRSSAMFFAAAFALAAQVQTPPGETFEDLARKAESALDTRPAEAVTLYRKALALRPYWGEGWMYLGAANYSLHRYAEASDAFRKGLRIYPRNGTALAFLGLCEAELDNIEQALTDIGAGEQLGLGDNLPFEIAVRVRATQLLIESARFGEAKFQLWPLSRRDGVPEAAVVNTMGLLVMSVAAKYDDLSGRQRAAVSLAGKAAWALATQHPEEAAAAYQQLLKEYPAEPGVHYAHGMYLMETDPAAGLAEFRKEVDLHPDHWPALIMVGSLEMRAGNADQALDALRKAIRLAPADQRWICHAQIGQAYMTGDRLSDAIAEFEIAVNLMPNNAPIRFLLAQAYRRAGKKDDAEREQAVFEKLKVQEDPLGVGALRPFGSD